MNKKTVVIGATPNPDRYAYRAVSQLKAHGHEVVPMGIRKGAIEGQTIVNDRPQLEDVDTVSLYINEMNQIDWKKYVEALHPKRVIFNPGTENMYWMESLEEKGIEVVEGCTLVMLSIGTF
jgi:predicted CoA-binding protein